MATQCEVIAMPDSDNAARIVTRSSIPVESSRGACVNWHGGIQPTSIEPVRGFARRSLGARSSGDAAPRMRKDAKSSSTFQSRVDLPGANQKGRKFSAIRRGQLFNPNVMQVKFARARMRLPDHRLPTAQQVADGSCATNGRADNSKRIVEKK
ncbi:MAG TPA: hypothetical protein VHB46_19430 [Burkholderiales bacterium]|nr:hypothetical protein [Burkholderiales bacterium]